MPDFTVKISTPADLEGAKALEQALAVARDKAEALGQSTADLDAQLAKVRASIAGAGEASGKAAGETEKLELHHHQLHEVLQQVAPGLAQLASFLTTDFAGAIGIVLVAFSYLNDQLEKFKKFLDDTDTGPGARGEWAEKIADNTREAAVAMAQFNEKLRETAVAQETLDTITDRLIQQQKAQADAAKEVGDAQKGLDIARLELAEKLGQLTPDQAVKIRLEIDDAAFKRQLAAETAAIQAELTARQQQFAANEGRQPDLQRDVQRTAQAALDAQNARDKNAAKLAQDQKNLADLPAKIKATEDAIDARAHGIFGLAVPQSELAQDPEYQEAQRRLTELHRLQGSYQTSARQEQGRQTGLESNAAVAKQQSDLAQSAYEAGAKMETDVVNMIADLQTKLAAASAKNRTLTDLHNQTSAIRGASAGDIAGWQTQGASAHEQGPQSGIDAQDAVTKGRNILSTLAGQGGRGTAGQMAQVHSILDRIMGYVESQSSYVQNQHVDLRDVERRLEDLEQRNANNRWNGQ